MTLFRLAKSNCLNMLAVVGLFCTSMLLYATFFGASYGLLAGSALFLLFILWKPLNFYQVNTYDPDHGSSDNVHLDLIHLNRELKTVTNWFVLGLHLGVTPCQLKVLKNKKMSIEYKRLQMLVKWINNYHKPTWSTVVHALQGMNELQLAQHIAIKYGVTETKQMQTSRTKIPEMSQLNIELMDVVHWFDLGIHLGIPITQLRVIERKHHFDTNECRTDMLMTWISITEPRWHSIVNALIDMKHYNSLAKHLTEKYLAAVPPISDSSDSPAVLDIFQCIIIFYPLLYCVFCSLILNCLNLLFFGNRFTLISVVHTLSHYLTLLSWISTVTFTVVLLVLFSWIIITLLDNMSPTLQSNLWNKRDDVTFKELINDLKDMTEWWLLGKAVGIPQAQLLIIGRDEKTTDACKIAVLRKWTKLEKPTWFKVVYSLFKCGMTTLGWELAAKHCVPVTPQMISNSNKISKNPNFKVDESCNDGFQEALVCPTGLPSIDGIKEVSVKDLLSELEEVITNWFVLGVFLNIPESKLCEIRQDYENDEECKMEMLMSWKQLSIPTWNAIVDALAKIGMDSLAIKLARKYDVPLPNSLRCAVEKLKQCGQSHSLDQAHTLDTSLQCTIEVKEILESKPLGGISLSEMLQELNGVIVEWFMLGIYLNITPEALKIIQAHRETEEDHQRNMLIKWSEVDIPTWEKLIHALMMIKKYDVAINIAITHRVPLPQSQVQKLKETSQVPADKLRILEVAQTQISKCAEVSMPDKKQKEPSLLELKNELKEVIEWFCLGIHLCISPSKLKAIQKDYGREGPERCKVEMLIVWQRTKLLRTWDEIVQALRKMGLEHLAKEIAANHNVPFHEMMTDSSAGVEYDDKPDQEQDVGCLFEAQKRKSHDQVSELSLLIEQKENDFKRQEEQLKEVEKTLKEKVEELERINEPFIPLGIGTTCGIFIGGAIGGLIDLASPIIGESSVVTELKDEEFLVSIPPATEEPEKATYMHVVPVQTLTAMDTAASSSPFVEWEHLSKEVKKEMQASLPDK